MKNFVFIICFMALLTGLAYKSAQKKTSHKLDLQGLQVGISSASLKKLVGSPTTRERNQLTYILDDASVLTVTLRDDVVTSAKIKYKQPIRISDPMLRTLTLVQMELEDSGSGKASWFFAGEPAKGHIYKITGKGRIESLTWVAPFTYTTHSAKNVQALFRDFQSNQSSQM